MTDAKVGEPCCRSDAAHPTALDLSIEWRRITGLVALLDGLEVDLRHGRSFFDARIAEQPFRLEGAFDRNLEDRADQVVVPFVE